MAQAINETALRTNEEHEVKYIPRSALFGLVRWNEKISTKHIGTDIEIATQGDIRAIYLNGKEIWHK